jgi:hypothetical protein
LGLVSIPLLADQPDFARDIQPILSDHCFQCHGPDESSREAELRLDTKDDLLTVIGEPADRADSELLRRIFSDDPEEQMPPPSVKRPLSIAQKAAIASWVKSGAQWEGHWAFSTPNRPVLPSVSQATWPANAIDYFVINRLDQEGLTPAPAASRERLLRRVSFDLTGLPPTIDELQAFLADTTPLAYERVVDRLLASPRLGERLAMNWLDIARYADTNGYQGDRERTMWPWRDWVVEAVNRNLPYDDFTVWQLAGDLLPDSSTEQQLATGFCRNHMINGEGGRIPEENRVEYIFDQIETLGTVWMGMTLQCCRCHDHKFDALTQAEYYQLFAFFNQTPISGAGGDPQMPPNLAVPTQSQRVELADLREELARQTRLLERREAELKQAAEKASDEVQAAFRRSVRDRRPEQWRVLEERFGPSDEGYVQASRRWREARDELSRAEASVPRVMVMRDQTESTRETFILEKGLYNQPREGVSADVPAALPPLEPDIRNRLALARWLVSSEHPLTARVTVNRLWQMLFGTGLVKTPEDFGVQGEQPSHPRLLDWLACELVSSQWDLKQLLRLIVTSSTYQQTASASPKLRERDPDNRWLARGPRHRLPAWMIRDQALAASGLLVGDLGGAPVKPYQPAGVWAEATFGNKRYQQDVGAALYRRSLYVFWRRIVGPTMFFDSPKRQTCSVKSSLTNTPLHALVTLNDATYVEAARAMATRVMQVTPCPEDRISLAFRLACSREPAPSELAILLSRLRRLRNDFETQAEEAEQLTEVGELPVAADVDRGELASYTGVCLLILNLDESLSK